MRFKRTCIETGKTDLLTPNEFLAEVNAERSDDWTPYDLADVTDYPQEIIDHWMNNDFETWEAIQ